MTNQATHNGRVLLIEEVEDDSSLSDAMRDKLTLEGFHVLQAKNGKEGLALALSERPDLILLDILMPKMDGMAMMKKLRKENEWGKTVPIIILTNLGADDDKINKTITETEPAYYLVKANTSLEYLVAKVKERLLGE